MPRGPKGEKRAADRTGDAVHVMRICDGEVSFDDRAGQHRRQRVKAERIGGLEIDRQFVLNRRLHPQICFTRNGTHSGLCWEGRR
jgi:hypothetical protein